MSLDKIQQNDSFLLNELLKNKPTQIHISNKQSSEYESLNRMRIAQSQSEAEFPEYTFNPKVGTFEGVKLNRFLMNNHRYQLSQQLVLPLDNYERTLFDKKLRSISKLLQPKKANIAFKALLGLFFINNIYKYRNNIERNIIQRKDITACPKPLMGSFFLFAGACALI